MNFVLHINNTCCANERTRDDSGEILGTINIARWMRNVAPAGVKAAFSSPKGNSGHIWRMTSSRWRRRYSLRFIYINPIRSAVHSLRSTKSVSSGFSLGRRLSGRTSLTVLTWKRIPVALHFPFILFYLIPSTPGMIIHETQEFRECRRRAVERPRTWLNSQRASFRVFL